MTKKQLIKVSGAILNSYIALHYLEEIEKIKVLSRGAKGNLTKTIKNLKEIELNYFDVIDGLDEHGLSDKVMEHQMVFTDYLLNRYDFHHFTKIQEVLAAYDLDYKRLTGISDKILMENGAKK